jgi:hypothetical protein
MGAFGLRLVTATPGRPVQNVRSAGRRLPDKSEEQAAHFGHGEWQELHRQYDAV